MVMTLEEAVAFTGLVPEDGEHADSLAFANRVGAAAFAKKKLETGFANLIRANFDIDTQTFSFLEY